MKKIIFFVLLATTIGSPSLAVLQAGQITMWSAFKEAYQDFTDIISESCGVKLYDFSDDHQNDLNDFDLTCDTLKTFYHFSKKHITNALHNSGEFICIMPQLVDFFIQRSQAAKYTE